MRVRACVWADCCPCITRHACTFSCTQRDHNYLLFTTSTGVMSIVTRVSLDTPQGSWGVSTVQNLPSSCVIFDYQITYPIITHGTPHHHSSWTPHNNGQSKYRFCISGTQWSSVEWPPSRVHCLLLTALETWYRRIFSSIEGVKYNHVTNTRPPINGELLWSRKLIVD